MEIKKVRDLTLVKIDSENIMVIACDSCGSIGMKDGDALKVEPNITGKFAARVPLMEVICSGAEIVTITDAVCNEMKNTGEEIIKGIKEELKLAGIDNITLTGSTEENFQTSMTAIGITVVGIAKVDKLKVNNVKKNSLVISIGLPKVGNEIKFNVDEDIIQYEQIYSLLSMEEVYEIVPVGSKGILYEANQLADWNKRKFFINENIKIDINKSAGPSTVAVLALSNKAFNEIEMFKNIHILGEIK